jgi:hypothetical protein
VRLARPRCTSSANMAAGATFEAWQIISLARFPPITSVPCNKDIVRPAWATGQVQELRLTGRRFLQSTGPLLPTLKANATVAKVLARVYEVSPQIHSTLQAQARQTQARETRDVDSGGGASAAPRSWHFVARSCEEGVLVRHRQVLASCQFGMVLSQSAKKRRTRADGDKAWTALLGSIDVAGMIHRTRAWTPRTKPPWSYNGNVHAHSRAKLSRFSQQLQATTLASSLLTHPILTHPSDMHCTSFACRSTDAEAQVGVLAVHVPMRLAPCC